MKNVKSLLIYALLCIGTMVHAVEIDGDFEWVVVKNAISDRPIEGVSVTVNQVFIGETGPLGRIRVPSGHYKDVISFYHTSFSAVSIQRYQLKRSGFAVRMFESVLNIQEVVIKANRVEQDYKKTPQEVRTIDAKKINSQFVGTTADALGLDPNVFIQKSQSGGGSPMIRGMSTSRVLVLVDGIRMNNAIFRSGNVHNVISIDGSSIANMEISLGPGSVLHGSDAMGGVMHINTYDAHYGDSTEVLQSLVFDFSANNAQLTRRPSFRLNYGGLNWAGMTSLTYSQFSDLRMGRNVLAWTPSEHLTNVELNNVPISYLNLDTTRIQQDVLIQARTGYEQRNFTQKLKLRVNTTTEVKSGLYASFIGDVNRYDRFIQTQDNGLPKYAYWNYGPQIWGMAFVALENRSKTVVSDWVKLTASAQSYQESRNVRKYRIVRGSLQEEHVRIAQINLDASKKINNRLSVLYGAENVNNMVESKGYEYYSMRPDSLWSAQSRYADGSTWQSSSVFLNTNYDISSSLSLATGGRLNAISMYTPISFNGYENEANWNFVAPSGSIGLTYFKPSFKYFLNLSTGFRAPNVDDASKVFDSQPGSLIIPNADLHEERLYSAELGMKQKVNSWMAIDASFYYSYLNNVMVRAPYNFQGRDSVYYQSELSQVIAIQNMDYAWIWGYQFGIRSQ